MTAIWVRARAEIRARWRAALSLALLVGISGGVVMAAAQGARRTDTAYPRFFRATHGIDIGVAQLPFPGSARFDMARLRTLPQVLDSAEIRFFESDVGGIETETGGIEFMASPDPRLFRDILGIKVLEGRRPRPERADEVIVSFPVARRKGIEVGDALRLRFAAAGSTTEDPIYAPPMPLRVVGIGAVHWDFPPSLTLTPGIHATPAFYRENASRLMHFGGVAFRLRRGPADLPAFDAELERQAGDKFYFSVRSVDHVANVRRSIHLQAVALWLLAGLAGASALLVLSQTLARQMFLDSAEHPTLRALGMGSSQLWAVGMVRAVAVTVAGAILAVGIAVALSPLAPIGIARIAEPSPGFAADWTVLGVGAAATILSVVALAAVPGWRASRVRGGALGVAEPVGHARPSRAAGALARAGFSASAVAGVRMALEPGRGRTAVPVRTTLAGVTLGVLALATAFSFGASLQHLLRTPRLFGWAWDAQFSLRIPFPEEQTSEEAQKAAVARGEAIFQRARRTLEEDPRVGAFSFVDFGLPVRIGRMSTELLMVQGEVRPPIVEGRAPGTGREIVLGTETLRALGKGIGDRVSISAPGIGVRAVDMRVVGRAVFPPLSDATGLGKGALVSLEAFAQIVSEDVQEMFGQALSQVVVRFAPGVDRQKAIQDLRTKLIDPELQRARRPRELVNFGQVDNLPVILAGGVAAVALATLAHTLVTSIRRRRRDLAILKTIGFVRGQVSRSVAWQATTIAAIALAIGIPAGIGAGRWAWSLFADRLGIVAVPIVEIPVVLLILPATILLANLIAALPARAAGRMQPALALRTE